MRLKAYEYRDPQQVVAAVAARQPLRDGDVTLVLVRDPSRDQEVVRVWTIPRKRQEGLDRYERSRLLADCAQRLRVPQRRGAGSQWYSIMTIVARKGFAVFGPDEGQWLHAWLFSNHLTGAFSGELTVVTEHGWADHTTGWGGPEPHLHAVRDDIGRGQIGQEGRGDQVHGREVVA